MSLSRNVNLDKMSVCHEGHEGSTDCNAAQVGSVNYHREVYHWWGSNTVDGGSMDMKESAVSYTHLTLPTTSRV